MARSVGRRSGATAGDDDYELRRSRTPVPEWTAEAADIHLGKLYEQEVSREGPADVTAWWEDVDGTGTSVDDWISEVVAPLLLVLGCIDVCMDHPKLPEGETVETRDDELRLGLDKCVASYILPQNMVWWQSDNAGNYTECLVREYIDPADRKDLDDNGDTIDPDDPNQAGDNWRNNYIRWRHWTATESTLYSYAGDRVLSVTKHPFGRVPIKRFLAGRKLRTPNVGKSPYEAIAALQREYYNRSSELILSDTLQSSPLLSGAEDFCKADNTLSIGPGYVLPKKKNPETGQYEGWEYVSPPKDPADSLRQNMRDLEDQKDRHACLIKPAGGVAKGTVSQSGISKAMDADSGNKLLAKFAKWLAKAERFMAELAMLVLRNGELDPADRKAIKIVYPARFDLMLAAERLDGTIKFQQVLATCGHAPNTERELIQASVRQLLPGLEDEAYGELDDEIDELVQTQATIKSRDREILPGDRSTDEEFAGEGTDESRAGADPSGQSGTTAVANMIPAVM